MVKFFVPVDASKHFFFQVLYQFNVPWPPQFDCAQFPRFGQGGENLCVGEANQGSFTSTELKDHQTTTLRPGRPSHFDQLMDFVCPAALQVIAIRDTTIEILKVTLDNILPETLNSYQLYFRYHQSTSTRCHLAVAVTSSFKVAADIQSLPPQREASRGDI